MITFLGDIALLNSDIQSQYIPDSEFIANFEYVCTDIKLKPIPGKINISSPYLYFKSLFGRNPIALNVANNHILDFGIKGFECTINSINNQGISTIGDKVYWYNDKTCILAYTLFCGKWEDYNVIQFTKDKAEKEIERAKSDGAQCIIVNMHWGIENYSLPDNNQKELGRWLIDKGADIVIGHHPHCIQPIEKYKDKYIIYSIGNCIFPSFNLYSHYDSNGVPHRKYRFKWRKWNNKGLAIIYDEINKEITRIDELYFSKNILKCTHINVKLSKYLLTNAIKPSLARLQLLYRKYWLFFISNCLVDGKIFDLKALKSELKK